MPLDEHGGWAGVLGRLTAGEDLSPEVTRAVLSEILAGDVSSARIAAFIVGLRMKGETVDELVGLREAMLAAAEPVPLDLDEHDAVDLCGTGGDRSGSINVSSIAALVVAGAGVPVVKHGNRAASSQCGSADVYEALGIDIEQGPEEVAASVIEHRFGFCFARTFHPAMRHVGPTRQELGVPTVFNVLGPLTNPARVRRQLLGVGVADMADRMAGVLAASGTTKALIVHGDDGMDELTTTTTSTVRELEDGVVTTSTVDPTTFGLAPATADDLAGGDAPQNASAARAVLAGEPGPHRDIVLLNAGAALLVADAVATLEDGVSRAAASVDDGSAEGVLTRLTD